MTLQTGIKNISPLIKNLSRLLSRNLGYLMWVSTVPRLQLSLLSILLEPSSMIGCCELGLGLLFYLTLWLLSPMLIKQSIIWKIWGWSELRLVTI